MHTCSSKEKKLPFGNCFAREPQAVPPAFWKGLDRALPLTAPCRPSMALCNIDVQTRHLPGDSGSLEKALASGPSSSWAQVPVRRPGRSCGPRRLAPERAPSTGSLSQPEGRRWWLQRGPCWRRQLRGRCLQVETSNDVMRDRCRACHCLFSFTDT